MGDVYESIDEVSLEFIINHVFVPPKLPQQPEVDAGLCTSLLLELCANIAQQYHDQGLHLPAWEAVLKMLKNFSALDNPNSLDAKAFRTEVRGMKDGDVLALHIEAQNAGLILQATSAEIIFQSFEVSPLSEEVLKPVGKLRCSYPGPAIAVSLEKVLREEFLRELSSFLEKIKRDTTLAPDVHSRGASNVAEERQSAHPMFITELLFGILRGMGKPATVNRFEKRVGDEVNWERARVPWRRSPLWSTVKIALQITIMIRADVTEYKLFMIYFIASILKIAVQKDVASDILFSMNAKLVGRVGKLMERAGDGDSLQPSNRVRVLEIARTVSESCVRVLETRWQETRTRNKRSSSWAFYSLTPSKDINLSMKNSSQYIEWARTWGLTHVPSREQKMFHPEEPQRLQHAAAAQVSWTLPTSAVLTDVFMEGTGSSSLTKDCALADIERWIECHLIEWTMEIVGLSRYWIEEQCEALGDLIHNYVEFGKLEYNHNPERMSLFYLTMMEMWVAMDVLALKCYPILADYSLSYFTEGFLHPLLLPEPSQRNRLESVESYLNTRNANAQRFAAADGIFSGVPTKNSFPVRYFDLEPIYATLRETILQHAEQRKEKKDRELRKKIKDQMALKERAHKMSCGFYIHHKDGSRRHQSRCQKCLRIAEAERMTVEVFEWPLPDDDLKSKAVVFELQCPAGFSVWRDVTYLVLQQVSAPPNATPPTSKKARKGIIAALPFEYLDKFPELCNYYQNNRQLTTQQVHWASSTKSFLSSHYRFQKLPTDLNSVCVRNNLNFGFFDKLTQRWITKGIMRDCNIQSKCTFKILDGPYKTLQFALKYDPCSPNEAVARQAGCPPEIQLNEFLAFSLVRSGRLIQWLNILRELRTRTLTFNSEAVNMLFTLCAWQAGPPGNHSGVYREAHTHFQDGQFVEKLLDEMNIMLADIKTNWQEAVTVKTLIALGTQLLMFYDTKQHASAYSFQQRIVVFLKQARAVCLDWVRDLATALHECDDPQETRKLQSRVVQIAAICRGTYNVEISFLPLLLVTEADVAELIECATLIHDNLSTSSLETMQGPLRMLFERDRRLAHKLENYLKELIVDTGVKVDLSRVWSGGSYEQNSYTWTAEEKPSERWIKGVMSKGLEIVSHQIVHYNLLTGRLLVDGKPLGRLPPEYLAHPVYQELFGEKLLIVSPAPSPMDFATKHSIFGHWVFFAMEQDELIIRSRPHVGLDRYHLIPKSKLKGDFPAHIIEKYVFWFSLRTRRIELRLRSKPWKRNFWRDSEPRTHYPYITSPLETSTLRLLKSPTEHLIDIRSDTAKMIHGVFSPLEYDSHIDVNLKQYKTSPQPVVEVNLPRLKLAFFVNEWGQLKCRQFLNMIVDRNQNLDTFIGLENKLIVRQGNLRSVIIPYGNVTFRSDDRNHVVVEISTRPSGFDRVRHHIYTIDETLGRLVGNGSLANHLYKVYLHAVTSSCMPDPLTKTTGTETALALLRSAATWSFQRLENDVEANILRLIASLSPQRVFYPKHLRCMQQVTWNQTLSPLSQHESFDLIVQDVFSHAASLRMFTDGNEEQDYYTVVSEPHLARRAAFRNSRLRRDEFMLPLEIIPGKSDVDLQYIARDRCSSPEEAKVHYVAKLVKSWPRRLVVCPDLLQNFIQWGTIDGQQVEELGYDEKLLDTRISDIWFDLQRTFLDSSRQSDMFSIMFTLATLAFKGSQREGLPLPLIGTLLAFATVPKIQDIQMPKGLCYDFSAGFQPDEQKLTEVVKQYVVEFALSNEAKLRVLRQETGEELALRRAREYAANVEHQVSASVRRLIAGWSLTHQVPTLSPREFPLIAVNDLVMRIGQMFSTWYDNMMFKSYMDRLQNVLDRVNIATDISPEGYSFTPYESVSKVRDPLPLYEALFNRPPSRFSNSHKIPPAGITSANQQNELQAPLQSHIIIEDLQRLLAHFSESTRRGDPRKAPKADHNHGFTQRYATDLMHSMRALGRTQAKPTMKGLTWDVWSEQWKPQIQSYRDMCAEYLSTIFNDIEKALVPSPDDYGSWMMYRAGLWPQICRRALLQRLAATTFATLPSGWKHILVQYGTAITMLQRAERLLRMGSAQIEGGGSDLIREIENTGHQAWNPLQQPDWLLMEIESNILIRPVQAEVATTMITPPEEKNTIMQLLMGEGKTSIIVPIVATSLADGGKLVRVVVLKPLCGQMFQMLVQRLGGLVNRRVFFMPFSRKINLSSAQVRKVREIMVKCRNTGGVLVVQPEHILSFKLLGLEHLFNAQAATPIPRKNQDKDAKEQILVAKELIDTQHWLESNARDILDESDEILNTRHELIYTIGNPKPIEHHPQRWLVVQEVLSLMALVLKEMKFKSTAFEIDPREAKNGEFNSIRILDQSQGEILLRELAKRIIDSQLSLISFRHWEPRKQALGIKFLTSDRLGHNEISALTSGDSSVDGTLLLLRGLIAYKILMFTLHEKRWKVDYGLDLKRSMLAVPYRAKDSPSGQSEFSHPDVAITLTCLSYYYGGLTENQLEIAFRTMLKTDNPTLEYEKWWKIMTTPQNPELKHLNAVNLEDTKQWSDKIVPMFSFNKAVIDFYLSRVVFPLEAKEFEHKLSSSGWDIAEKKQNPTTGFSGTNDNRYLLPQSIQQYDTKQQLDTNASVLSYLLTPSNFYISVQQENGARLGTEGLLLRLNNIPGGVLVLLDVGAQVLEWSNEQVASNWLGMNSIPHNIKAAVYFNDDDELTVLTKDGVQEPLMISAFADRLDHCLVYLDEAHTRGTDLKLPLNCRAAVTLGPNLTKDRLVQACMRMRKLGSGHSVVFCGPPEIDRELRALARAQYRNKIEVRDVIHWSMEQTCSNTSKMVSIWIKQGLSHRQRHLATNAITSYSSSRFPNGLLEKEAKTLDQHYGLERAQNALLFSGEMARDTEIKAILDYARTTFGVESAAGASMLEEQERELCHEIECERENQRPPPAEASKHQVSYQLLHFIASGKLPPKKKKTRDESFIPAFDILSQTAAGKYLEHAAWPKVLLLTKDCSNTIIQRRNTGMDDYLMPVNWVLSSSVDERILVILNSWEVNTCMAEIQKSTKVTLHMYSPRTTKASPSYDCLDYFTLPQLSSQLSFSSTHQQAIDLLGLFSGQTYFPDYASYERICGFLGLYLKNLSTIAEGNAKNIILSPDGYVMDKTHRVILGMPKSPFDKNPLPLLRVLMGLRRKGQSYLGTHVGCILHGRQLRVEDID